MSRHMVPVMLGLTVFPLAAMGAAAYLLLFPSAGMTMVAGAVMLLAVCLLLSVIIAAVRLSRQEEWLWSLQDNLRDVSRATDMATDRVAAAERQLKHPAAMTRVNEIADEVGALRREMQDFVEAQRRDDHRHDHPAAPEPAADSPGAGPTIGSPKPEREQLTLLLEPVIELSSGTTTHYRALLALADSRGNMVNHDELMQKADQGGMRPALDVRMVKMVAPVLRRLRIKHPGLRVLVPLGQATLGSQEEAQRLIDLLQRENDVTGGMVFEFAQQDLGELDATGIENLARLARSGATLALRDVYLGGLDLTALRQLGVRFLSFPPHAVDAGSGPNRTWSDFVKEAKALQIQIMVGGIKTPQQATAASKVARFGHGPFFAPPRRVRPDAGVAPSAFRSANVA